MGSRKEVCLKACISLSSVFSIPFFMQITNLLSKTGKGIPTWLLLQFHRSLLLVSTCYSQTPRQMHQPAGCKHLGTQGEVSPRCHQSFDLVGCHQLYISTKESQSWHMPSKALLWEVGRRSVSRHISAFPVCFLYPF